jgi:hypothetical protein
MDLANNQSLRNPARDLDESHKKTRLLAGFLK